MEYNFREIEKKWHDYWIAEKVYKVEKDTNKPKYYVLDMFPILRCGITRWPPARLYSF